MARANRNHNTAITALAVLGGLVVLLVFLRPAKFAPATSPEASVSFHRKISALKEAYKNGVRTEVRISETELNSALEDFDNHAFDNVYWPPPGTKVYLRGNLSGVYIPHKLRGVLLHFRVDVRGRTLYPEPGVFWFGIIPVPAKVVESILKRFTGDSRAPLWEKSEELPKYISGAHIEKNEVVLETH